MARIEWIRLRLENWALWKSREGGGGSGWAPRTSFSAERVDCDRYRESTIPIDEVDASVTDQAVTALQAALPEVHRVLKLYYLSVWAGSPKKIGQLLGRDQSTVYAQLDQADRWIQTWFNDRHDRQMAARRVYVPTGNGGGCAP